MRPERSGAGAAPRLVHLDALRGLAALSVTWFHLTNTYPAGVVRMSGAHGWVGVEVFFIISGFIIPYSLCSAGYRSGKDALIFMQKRFIRIEIPYVMSILLILILNKLSTLAPGFRGPTTPIDPLQVIAHLGYVAAFFGYPWLQPVFWTLAIEFQFYIGIAIFLNQISANVFHGRVAMIFILSLAPFVIRDDRIVLQFADLFACGIALMWYKRGHVSRRELYLWMGCLLAGMAIHRDPIVVLIAGMTTVIIMTERMPGMAWLARIGTISYSLYLLHVPIGGRVVNLGTQFDPSALGQLMLSLVALTVSFAAAWSMWRVVEHPAERAARRIRFTGAS